MIVHEGARTNLIDSNTCVGSKDYEGAGELNNILRRSTRPIAVLVRNELHQNTTSRAEHAFRRKTKAAKKYQRHERGQACKAGRDDAAPTAVIPSRRPWNFAHFS